LYIKQDMQTSLFNVFKKKHINRTPMSLKPQKIGKKKKKNFKNWTSHVPSTGYSSWDCRASWESAPVLFCHVLSAFLRYHPVALLSLPANSLQRCCHRQASVHKKSSDIFSLFSPPVCSNSCYSVPVTPGFILTVWESHLESKIKHLFSFIHIYHRFQEHLSIYFQIYRKQVF